MDTVTILEPLDRIRHFGIECVGPVGDGIEFLAGHWKPGGEYIQKLTVKNVSSTVKKLKYKLPSTRFFSLAFPEVITLSPGMFKEIDVVFRPVELAPYDDTIYIKMQEGSNSGGFHVPVVANIPKLIISAPFGLDLGYCPTYQWTKTEFHITNVGEVDAPFCWTSPAPFIIEPFEGIVPVGESQAIEVSIFPTDASVFVSQAVCNVGNDVFDAIIPDPVLTTRLSAIGKYAFISLSEKLVEFGEVLCGTPPESIVRDVILRNNSVVPAEFELKRHDQDRDEVFDIYPESGVVPPQGEVAVTVHYHSLAAGCFSLDRYTFQTPGDCRTTLTCRGFSLPLDITIRRDIVVFHMDSDAAPGVPHEGGPMNSINFRDNPVGVVETRIFYLQNHSSRDAIFSIIADPLAIFRIEPRQGTIKASLEAPVKIFFYTSAPINFYRRFFILISDSLPLYVDVMGSAFIRAKGEVKEQRPAPLRHAHIQAFRNRCVQGLGRMTPDELDLMYSQYTSSNSPAILQNTLMTLGCTTRGDLSDLFSKIGKVGTQAMSIAAIQSPLTRTGNTSRFKIAPAHEFFIEHTSQSIVKRELSRNGTSGGKVETVREIIVSHTNLDFGYTPFRGTSASKRVSVTNTTNGKVTVHWFVPRISGGKKEGEKGKAGIPLGEPAAFTIVPECADLNAGQSATFDVTFRPGQADRHFFSELEAYVYFKNQRTFRLVNDSTLSPPWCLTLSTSGHTFYSGQLLAKARLSSSGIRSGKLLFPCGYLEDFLYQTIILRNTSNLPCEFSLHFLSDESNSLDVPAAGSEPTWTVKPMCGSVAAEDFLLICVRFHPTEMTRYTDTLLCNVNGADSGKVLLEGHGDVPYIVCPDVALDDRESKSKQKNATNVMTSVLSPLARVTKGFIGSYYMKPTCVGLSNTRLFTIFNASRLPLRYVVVLPPLPQCSGDDDIPAILHITPLRGVLRGKEEANLSITFAPLKSVKYVFKLRIMVYPVGGKCPPQVLDARQPGPVVAPEVIQCVTMNIVCPADTGALLFDPARMAIDARLVGTHETRDVHLDNVSDSDISYRLFYKTEFTADSGELVKTTTVSDVVPMLVSKAENDLENNLFCLEPSGVLPARSRTLVPVVFHPSSAGLFEFLIYARIQSISLTNNSKTAALVLQSNEDTALARVCDVDREDNIPGLGIKSLNGVPLVSHVTGRASFPTMVLEDIRMTATDTSGVCGPVLVSNVDQLWKQFSLTALNYDLSLPLTEEESLLNTTSTPDLSKLVRYAMEFTPNTVGSNRQTAYIQLRNSGFLPTTFSLHLPTEKTLDLEPWCDEDEPTAEKLMHNAIIGELKCFTVEPRRATLQPNETCVLTITYSHHCLKYGGYHTVPILLKLQQGKMMWLDFIGRTMPSGASQLFPFAPTSTNSLSPLKRSDSRAQTGSSTSLSPSRGMTGAHSPSPSSRSITAVNSPKGLNAANTAPAGPPIPNILLFPYIGKATSSGNNNASIYWLDPVPIGLSPTEAPKQVVPLVNVSGFDIAYEVDTSPLMQLSDDNFDLPLVRLSNPKGVIPARTTHFLEYIYYPLEVKVYEWKIIVSYTEEVSTGVKFDTGAPTLTTMNNSFQVVGSDSKQHSRKSDHRGSLAVKMKPLSTVPSDAPLIRSLEFTVKAHGYDSREMSNTPPILPETLYIGGSPPRVPLLLHKEVGSVAVDPQSPKKAPSDLIPPAPSLARLSWDVVSFDNVPQYSRPRRLMIMYNMSTTSSIDFAVDDSTLSSLLVPHNSYNAASVLKITPNCGRLEPSSHIVLHLELNCMNCQPITFKENITITVKEVIKGVGRRSNRNKLFDSIRKKATTVEHASIVNKGTFARAMQIETNFMIPEDKIGSIPTTFNSHGVMQSVQGFENTKPLPAIASAPNSPMPSRASTEMTMPPMSPMSRGSELSNYTDGRTTGAATEGGSRHSVLSGPPQMHYIRVQGSIFSLATVNNVLNCNGPTAGMMDEFLIPPKLSFIPFRWEDMPSTTALMQTKAEAREKMKTTPSIFEMNNAVEMLEKEKRQNVAVRSRLSPGTLPTIPSPRTGQGTASPSMMARDNDEMSPYREEELRLMSLHVLSSLFKDIVTEVDSNAAVVRATSTCTHGLYFPASTGNNGAASNSTSEKSVLTIPEGQQSHGLYFSELVPPETFLERFVSTIISFGYEHTGSILSPSQDAQTGKPAFDTEDDAPKLVPAAEFCMSKVDLRAAVVKMKIQKKGRAFAMIDTTMREKIGTNVCVSEILAALPADTVEFVDKKLNDLIIEQNKRDLVVAVPAKPVARTVLAPLQTTMDSDEIDHAYVAAVKSIQGGSRVAAARVKANKIRDEVDQKAADLLFVKDEGFFEMVGDILHNTMFNLIQEASMGEFQINADPLCFVVKK